jgi:hypothetical protein
MKRLIPVLLFLVIFAQILNSQPVVSQGKPFAEIFTNFHYNLDDTSKTTGFGLDRVYVGYNYTPEGNFSAMIILNLGNPEDLAAGSVPKRYAYFREASVKYTKDRLTLNFGMVNTRFEDFQQGFWGKRYLGSEYQAIYGYCSVADLGVVVDYQLNDLIKINFSLLNGEGYTNVQIDNSLRTAIGIIINTPDNAVFKIYGDINKPGGVWQTTMLAFAGFKNDRFSFGAEASYKSNLDSLYGHNVWGISGTGSIFLNEKSEIFGRYDYTASVVMPGEDFQWDYSKDETYFIGGIQHIFSDNLKMALNYRRTNPYESGKQTTNAIYLNAAFRF